MIVPKRARNRRRLATNSDGSRHRRTRSGCYTCRSRRVKCDEVHPVCERCRKAGRNCVYPDPVTKATKGNDNINGTEFLENEIHDSSSEDDYKEDDDSQAFPAIPDEDGKIVRAIPAPYTIPYFTLEDGPGQSGRRKGSTRLGSDTPSLVYEKGASPIPSTEGSVVYVKNKSASKFESNREDRSPEGIGPSFGHLPQELQFYLNHYVNNITYLHYSLKSDHSNVMKTSFLDVVLSNEPLLYALVAFSAFHFTSHSPQGSIQDFLPYYNKAVSLLLRSLRTGEAHGDGMILAILQLATIEEYLGDLVNLLAHQKAAYHMLIELHTPETVVGTSMSRIILAWYSRFDIMAGLLGGWEIFLERKWFLWPEKFIRQQINKEPANLTWRMELASAQIRLIAMNMVTHFNKYKLAARDLTQEQFLIENDAIRCMIEDWKTNLDPALKDSRFLIDKSSDALQDTNAVFDRSFPGKIYCGILWPMNIAFVDWISLGVMHKYQTALHLRTEPDPAIYTQAYETCQLFEMVEKLPESPSGTAMSLRTALVVAFMYLPRNKKYHFWARRKLASLECQGYVYPPAFRRRMAALFQDQSCLHWWLPNNEGYNPTLQSFRKFVDERTGPAPDELSEDFRQMKALFAEASLVEQPTKDNSRRHDSD